MVKKGRSLKGRAGQKGSKHGRAKLNEEKVQEIKRLFVETNLTHKEIAGLFGVTERLISHIKSGKNWSHVVDNFHNITVNGNVTINNYSENKQLSLFDVEKFN